MKTNSSECFKFGSQTNLSWETNKKLCIFSSCSYSPQIYQILLIMFNSVGPIQNEEFNEVVGFCWTINYNIEQIHEIDDNDLG